MCVQATTEEITIVRECYCCTKNTEHIVFEGDENNLDFYECLECGCTYDEEDLDE